MFYVQNILKHLNHHFKNEKQSKKKIRHEEIVFCEKLIQQIEKFCLNTNQIEKERYNRFKASKLSISAYISKNKIKDKSKFINLIKKLDKPSTRSKYDEVKETVHQNFTTARSQGKNIHHQNLQRWAQKASSDLNLKRKCNSVSFAKTIKKKYALVSRRIQMLRNFKTTTEQEIIDNAETFIENTNEIIAQFPPSNVFNTDQTGINYEPVQKRTLAVRGTKMVASHIESKNKTTHSFTLQPYISLDGHFSKKLLVILQEVTGDSFGSLVEPRVRAVESECGNVIVRCTKSGNMNANLLTEFVHSFKRDNSGHNLLIWDSLSFQKTEKYEIPDVLSIAKIPASTTKYAQPLDSLINIQIKFMYKNIFWPLQDVDDYKLTRYDIIRLCSIVWNQLSSSVFVDLVKAGWSSCGYLSPVLNENHLSYARVKDVCFHNLTKCGVVNCTNESVIKCSHCRLELCIHHLIIENLHLHS